MKITTTLLFAFSITVCTAQFTIPNADFESWEFNGWNYSPTQWETGNSNLTQDTFQDSLPHSGVLAMRVEPIPNGVSEEGVAKIEIPTTAIPPSLDFWVKYARTLTSYMGVTIEFFNDDNSVYIESWQAADTLSDWIFVSLPLDQIEPLMTHVEIRVEAVVGDFAAGDGWIAVDDMSIGGVVDYLGENELPGLSIYPNPASQTIHIDLLAEAPTDMQTRLIDSSGRLVLDVPSSPRVDVSSLPAGIYVMEMLDAETVFGRETVVVSR